MEFNNYKSLKAAETALKKRGFDKNFKLDGKRLINEEDGDTYDPGDLIMIEYHRFPSEDDWQDTKIIFALEDQEGNRGLVTSNYRSLDYIQLVNFIDRVKMRSLINS